MAKKTNTTEEVKQLKEKSKKRGFWWWFFVILAILILLDGLNAKNEYKEYTLCVDDCELDFYCLELDFIDTDSTWYMEYHKVASCRNKVLSCLDDCRD